MSLINDALKRTQQTTQAQQPPRLNELELRPIEPIHPSPHNDGSGAKRILWIVVLLVVTGNVALWLIFKDRDAKDQVAARTAESDLVETPVSEPQPEPAQVAVTPAVPGPQAQPELVQATVAPGAMQAGSVVPAEQAPVIQIDRPSLKLKSIVTHPTRPSAMINNRVVFVGDRVEGYTVTVIGKDEVTLTKGDDEVVVTLP